MKASTKQRWFVFTEDIYASDTMFYDFALNGCNQEMHQATMVVTRNASGISQKIQAPVHVGRALFQPPEHDKLMNMTILPHHHWFRLN
jgi:hypothetical protein